MAIILGCSALVLLGTDGKYKKNKHEYYTLWNKQSIVRELERLGFEVIVAKRNFKASYSNYYDVHIIAQKRYF
jgi:hypothetical protein